MDFVLKDLVTAPCSTPKILCSESAHLSRRDFRHGQSDNRFLSLKALTSSRNPFSHPQRFFLELIGSLKSTISDVIERTAVVCDDCSSLNIRQELSRSHLQGKSVKAPWISHISERLPAQITVNRHTDRIRLLSGYIFPILCNSHETTIFTRQLLGSTSTVRHLEI